MRAVFLSPLHCGAVLMVLFLCSVSIFKALSGIIGCFFFGFTTCLISLRLGEGWMPRRFYADGGGEFHISTIEEFVIGSYITSALFPEI